tara:strand:+ start:319 stop:510 length:192 start_codon:yes stop_codon:yes gene_type:complete
VLAAANRKIVVDGTASNSDHDGILRITERAPSTSDVTARFRVSADSLHKWVKTVQLDIDSIKD